MSRARRFRGNEGCCTSNNIDPAMRGGEYWDSPWVVGAYNQYNLGGPMTPEEQDALYLISDGPKWFWPVVPGTNTFVQPPVGLPHHDFDVAMQRYQAAFQVVQNGGGPLNRIRNNNGKPEVLWCKPCTTVGEDFVNTISVIGAELSTAARVFAMVISYVPVFGTAVAFVIDASVSLANGEDITDSVLDGIGGALPGQPVSGAAFNAARAVVSGKDIDDVAISALPVDDNIKRVISIATKIAIAIANGEKIATITLKTLYDQLPDEGKKAMDIASRVASGEDPVAIAEDLAKGELVKTATYEQTIGAMQKAYEQAKAMGPDAVNSFLAQAGYQGALDTLPDDVKAAVSCGIVAGHASVMQVIQQGGFTTQETDKRLLDAYAAKGQAIINGPNGYWITGPTNYKQPLANVRASKQWTIQHTTRFDALSGQTIPYRWTETVNVDDAFRRGFDVGIGVAEGNSIDGPGQQRARAALTLLQAQKGFDAAQAIQFKRTQDSQLNKGLNAMANAIALGRTYFASASDRSQMAAFAAKGATIAASDPSVAAARSLNSDPRFRWGFDIASGLCQGMSIPGPGQTAWRNKLGTACANGSPDGSSAGSAVAQQGFDVGQALQHGITKAIAANQSMALAGMPPTVASGTLIANGITNSGSPADVKAGVISSTLQDPGVKAGAVATVKQNEGFFAKILHFFGIDI